MALVDQDIVEMPDDPTTGAMPPYRRLVEWVRAETDGLVGAQLDFDDASDDTGVLSPTAAGCPNSA